jgi:hypothetical protein
MIALGIGMQESVIKEFDSFGSLNVLEVSKKNQDNKLSRYYEEELVTGLTDADLVVLEGMDGVELAAPMSSAMVTIYTSKHKSSAYLMGMDPIFMEEMGFITAQGRLPRDNMSEVVFGDAVLKGFQKMESDNPNAKIQQREEAGEEEEEMGIVISFGGPEKEEYPFKPLEERYKMEVNLVTDEVAQKAARMYSINGVGVLKEGDLMRDNYVYMPMSAFNKLVRSEAETKGIDYRSSYSQIMIKVTDIKQVKAIKELIESKGYSVFSLMSVLESVNKTIATIKLALGAIGGISLLVAAIGITNTMVMAITERKKEIGIMKVIGATFIDIKRLFLLEAAMIGLIGGGIGLGICLGISSFINSDYFQMTLLQMEQSSSILTISKTLVMGGLIFTTMIGVLSGYLPARKAMRSSALEAIRNE